MTKTIGVLLDNVAGATKAVCMINVNDKVSITVSTPQEKILLPMDVTLKIQDLLQEYVNDQKEVISQIMSKEQQE